MDNLPQKKSQKKDKQFKSVYAYIDNKKRKVGYAYLTKNGSLCIKGDKIIDKNQLGRLVANGVYVHSYESNN